MPKPAVKRFTSWSFTRWNDWRGCPLRAKLKHLDKLPEPPSAAMERGSAIHKLAEDYTLGRLSRLPAELKLFSAEFKELRKRKAHAVVEGQLTFRRDWSLTEWNDWTGAWLRVKIDAQVRLDGGRRVKTIDHKTGRMRTEKTEEYLLQLELYDMATLVAVETAETVESELWYLDHGVIYPDPDEARPPATREDAPRLQKLWLKRVEPMLADTEFKATPGDACRWCHYRKANGGPCKY